MEKAVIFGAFEFLGFHLCKRILDEGIEVLGVHNVNDKADNIEEKRMEIGRNANFSLEDIHKDKIQNEKVTVIVDFYDFFIKKQEEPFLECSIFEDILKGINKEESKVIILIPILLRVKEQYNNDYAKLKEKINLLKKENIFVQSIYLPTVYGPWQTKEFLFHQAIISSGKQAEISDREWTGDALYVGDIVHEIMKLIEEEKESYLLKSGEQDAWSKCAKYLNISHNPIEVEYRDFAGEERIVKMSSYKEGLEKQKLLEETLRLE